VREVGRGARSVNSSELRAADFHLAEVRPLQLDAVARGCRRTRGTEALCVYLHVLFLCYAAEEP